MKKLDSYRLLDLLFMVLCTGLGILFVFLISLGYNQIGNYFTEISDFPFFIAFLPSFVSSFIHACINFLGAKKHGHNLVDLTGSPAKKHHLNAFYIACGGMIISLILIILLLTKVIYSEDYIYVLASLPMGLLPYAYLLVIEVINIIKSPLGVLEKVLYLTCLALIGVGPLVLGLATYLPGVLGWSYLGISAFPLAYVVGDALSMSKEYGNISEGDEF